MCSKGSITRRKNGTWMYYFTRGCRRFRKYGFETEQDAYDAMEKAKSDLDVDELSSIQSPVILTKKIKQLERELLIAQEQGQIASMVKNQLRALNNYISTPPVWKVTDTGSYFDGIPTLAISDVHHAEVVDPIQVNYCNEFNSVISRQRIENTITKSVGMLDQTNVDYEGVVLALAGDMVSGLIHEELKISNDQPIFPAILDLSDILVGGINLLKERFGKVFVPCVVGNHGRLDRKPKYKYGPQDNYDYMLYHFIASRFEHDDDVTIAVSDAFTYNYKIFNTRYLLTHGDKFKGGGGITGPLLPWTRGDHKLRQQRQSMEYWTKRPAEYDVLVFGHWHQCFPGSKFIVNGSIKGFDEYAQSNQYEFEPPKQVLWLTHPRYGVTVSTSIYAEQPPKGNSEKWVSILD